MRREDLLQALLIRFVDPQREEQDWILLAALFYSLTRLLLSPQRVEQLYYKYLQLHGSRAAMEASCKEYELQLLAKLQKRSLGGDGPAVGVVANGHCLDIASSQDSRGARVPAAAVTAGFSPLASAGAGVGNGGAGGASGVASGPLLSCVVSQSLEDESGVDDGSFTQKNTLRQLTREQQERWHRLRQEPISPDVLTALLQRFTLMGDAAVFLSPVHPSTIMEFNGVRSGPYVTVVRHPLSLMDIKRWVLASRRDYELRRRHSQNSSSQNAAQRGDATRKRGRVAAASVSGRSEPANVGTRGGDDDAGVIRTLQELEQAVWHIAANCVVFNAPESYYPQTARQFAAACTDIIEEYCMQRLLGA